MRRATILCAALCAVALMSAHADPVVASVQQALKDQGFYYGEITGTKDADTTAAIRRYQIRNGLKITGDLNPETQKSLGIKGSTQSTPSAPAPRSTPPAQTAPRPVQPQAEDDSDLRDDEPVAPEPPARYRDPNMQPPLGGYAPGPRGLAPEMSGLFDGTPYEIAPPDVQRRVIIGAQSMLARRGYYRNAIDGIYGPAMEFALRSYQARAELEPTGRLDMETLASLGLLPGQREPGLGGPRRRIWRRPAAVVPGPGEPVYIPR